MKQSLLNEALSIIKSREEKADGDARKNLNLALKDKDFQKLYSDYTSLMIENAKKEAYGEKVDQKQQDDLKKKFEARLKELKISSIIPSYFCKKCNDTGFVDGKYCSCLKREITNLLLQKSGFEKLEDFKNSDFSIFEDQEEMKKLYKLMQTWCNKESDKNLVYLLGQTGTGKTHLLSCMANEFIKHNKIVMLTTAFNLSQMFIKYHSSKEKAEILDDLLSVEVLFIDDLGTEPFFNNITREYTYLIINERRMKNLKTVITSNLTPSELKDRYDERIFSRILDKKTSITLQLKGTDKRLKK